jgi:phage gp46-like protein
MNEFNGDLLLVSTPDGGDLQFANDCCFINDTGFDTAIYLSLFGGNLGDAGTESTKDKTWWGNLLEINNPERQLISRFQNLSRGLPLVPNNILKLKEAIKLDLTWFIDEGIIDKLEINMSIPAKNRLYTEIVGLKSGKELFKSSFYQNWLSKL